MGIFKPCDIRGVYGRELTDRDAYDLGRAAGEGGRPVLVGGDVRLSTPALKRALGRGLVDAGCRVVDAGILPTPAFYFAVRRTGAPLGVMVTASHNPPEYNGFKVLQGGRAADEAGLAGLRQAVAGGNFAAGRGSYRREEGWLARYCDWVIRHSSRGGLKVVTDCGNGAACLTAPGIFHRLGYRSTELYGEPDGRFPNRPPNPAVAANLAALCRRVAADGAAVGIAYDGDGDRVAFVDETGRPLANDRILALLARHLLRREKGPVVYDSKCSMVVAEEVARLGGTPVMARSGHGFVGRAFRERGALLAGELSGHFFWRDLGFDDGLFSSLVLVRLLEEDGIPLSRLDESLPRYRITPDIRLPFAGDPRDLVGGVARRLATYPLSRLDGVRVAFPDCWGLVRPSITEPLVTLRFEGKTAGRLSFVTGLVLDALPEELAAAARRALPVM